MAAKEVKKATVNLTCPICYQLFNNPKYLPCHHSYCEQCLEKMQVQNKIICPECRNEATVPAGGVKDLPNNFFINRMVDELVLKRKVEGEEEVKCDECDEDEPVVAYCPECNMFFCQTCNESHKRSKRSRGHGIVPLTELRSNEDAQLQAKVKIPVCKDHNYELNHYCETCDKLVCLYCTVKEHNGHNHDTVNNMATKHRNELKDVTAPVDEMIRDLSEAHDNIDKMKKKIRRQGDEVDKKIDQHYKELVQKLMKQKEQVKQQAHDAVSQKEKALTVQLEDVEYAQAEVLNMKELKDAIEKSSDQEALSAKKQVIDRMQQITDKFNKLNTDPLQSATMEFVRSKESFPQFGQLFTHIDPGTCEVVNLPNRITVGKELKFSIITKYRNGSQCSIGGSQVSVQLESNSGEMTSAQVRDNNDGSYMASFVVQQGGEVKLLAFVNGQQIKGNPYSVVIQDYTKVGKPSKIVNNDGNMGRSWGIAFGKNGMWAVADNTKHCVYIFDGQDQLIRKVGSHGNGNGQLTNPAGVTFDSNNHLYVADYGNRVQVFDVSGKYLYQFGSGGSGNAQLNSPTGITIHNNKVFVSNSRNGCISVFHTNGQFSHIIGKGQLCSPYDVSVNTNNQLLVADCSHNCIYTFTLDGNYVSKFATRGSDKGQLSTPCSLTTDLYGFILVAEWGNNRVSIFNKDGKFIHCFGSSGSDDGKFQCPCNIAISPNGNIYVSDHLNNRVQIFSTY